MKVQLGRYSLAVDLQALGLFALGLVWRLVFDVSKELLTNWRLQLSAGVAAAVMKLAGWL
jgi:predicted acyltransferase